jgi:hypothetical protein
LQDAVSRKKKNEEMRERAFVRVGGLVGKAPRNPNGKSEATHFAAACRPTTIASAQRYLRW